MSVSGISGTSQVTAAAYVNNSPKTTPTKTSESQESKSQEAAESPSVEAQESAGSTEKLNVLA